MEEESAVPAAAEEWRPVPGYEGLYEVSSFGRVRRVRGGYKNAKEGRVLTQDSAGCAYARVTLYRDIKANAKRLAVHHLVLAAFAGARRPRMVGCHNDGNSFNNAAVNLRWDTPESNFADRYRHGTDPRGERNPKAALTEAQVAQIRVVYGRGSISQSTIAKSHGVCQTTISRIVRGDTWTK